ncbi:PREDICTED: bromodomain-containing protein DDB_G0278469-like [Camelina sativa]|uniref:Bromodomain-containing protein DDB_G0278469-like n=1 Tax=Camelina sativa TaxID=90675 RepID=A0ABM0TQ79_CAMSA|nr:PREDICTED: bromodomain-containing protein DDB_G0278469-like [Camelina sativa]
MLDMSESVLTAMYSWFTPTVLFVFLNLMIGTIAISSSFSSTKSNDPNQTQIQRSPSMIHRLKSINFSSFTSPDKSHHLEFPPSTPEDNNNINSHQPASIEQNQPFLSRSPSVLHRIKSFNLYNYISQEPTNIVEAPPPSVTVESKQEQEPEHEQEEEEEEEETSPSLEEVYSKLNLNHVARTKSDTEPAAGIIPPKLPKKMKKSASTKSPFSHFQEDEISVEARRPATVKVPRVTTVEEADEEVDAKADDFINRFKHQLKLQRIDSITKYKEMVKKRNDK